jgi:hypothetical protein
MTMRLVTPDECTHPDEVPRLMLALGPHRSEVSMVEVVFCPDCQTWLTWEEWFVANGDAPDIVYDVTIGEPGFDWSGWQCLCGHTETEDLDNCLACGAERVDWEGD